MASATTAPPPRPQPLPDSAIPDKPPNLSKQLPKLGRPTQRNKTNSRPSNPPVETPTLVEPQELGGLHFTHPVRRILSPQDHELFLASPTHTLLAAFAFNLADSVKGKPISAVSNEQLHPTVAALLAILDKAEETHRAHPPEDNGGSRFGNPAFRSFVSALTELAPSWHTAAFPSLPSGAIDELSTYFSNSFGSATRIDYGSGHELNFLVYLLSLYRLSELPKSTFPHLALRLFPRYLSLMRALQASYYLEPAGSHGVWGLDDYHFLPFLFGASQLADHPFIRPLAIHSSATLDACGDDFLYLDMVRHVNATKTVQGLRWHSPMLDDISGVRAGWAKIADGMRRMFLREVIGKLVVMQHFLFGGIVPAVDGMATPVGDEVSAEDDAHVGHEHRPDSWDDCCGIRVPSSVGAAQEMKRRLGGGGLRPLPFD